VRRRHHREPAIDQFHDCADGMERKVQQILGEIAVELALLGEHQHFGEGRARIERWPVRPSRGERGVRVRGAEESRQRGDRFAAEAER